MKKENTCESELNNLGSSNCINQTEKLKTITKFKDVETPEFNNYKEKQRYFERIRKTFVRTEEDFSVKGIVTLIKNRYITVLSGFNTINQYPMYKEVKLTNN